MGIIKWLQELMNNIWEGVLRIFSPDRDDYPKTGVQPFTGEPAEEEKNSV